MLSSLNMMDLTNDIRDSNTSNTEGLIFLRHSSVTHWQDITSERNWIFALIGVSLVPCCLYARKNWCKFVGSQRCCTNDMHIYTAQYRVRSHVLEEVLGKKSQCTISVWGKVALRGTASFICFATGRTPHTQNERFPTTSLLSSHFILKMETARFSKCQQKFEQWQNLSQKLE
jgi:hypothetical protein